MTTRQRTSNLEPEANFEDEGVGELSVEEKYAEVKQLIVIGKEKGFLLYDEIYELLPEEVTSLPEELDEIYIRFNDLGIDVIEDAEKPLQTSPKGIVTIDGTIEEKEMDQREEVQADVRITNGSGVPQQHVVVELHYGPTHLMAKADNSDWGLAVREAREDLLRQINDRSRGGHSSFSKHA